MTTTTTIDTDATLGHIVTAHPDLARELERRSLDYCCGGDRTLAVACEAAGLDPVSTAAELAATATAPPESWTELDPAQLVDHLEATHHAYLHAELPRLAALVAKVHGVHGDRHPELAAVRRTFSELRQDLDPHLAKEEQILFPAIRALVDGGSTSYPFGSIERPISVMLREHDRAGELLTELRQLTDGYRPPADGCASFQALYRGLADLEADTHTHVHKENNSLFPRVVELERARQQA